MKPRTSTSISLAWTDQDDEDQYLIERSPDGQTGWTQIGSVPRDVSSFADTGVTSGTSYYYRLRASNSLGSSDYSIVASGKPFQYDIFLPSIGN